MAAIDTALGSTSPVSDGESVTPSDAAELQAVSRLIYVGGAGNLAVIMKNGQSLTFSAVPAGTLLPIRVRQIQSTGTTATLLLSLY